MADTSIQPSPGTLSLSKLTVAILTPFVGAVLLTGASPVYPSSVTPAAASMGLTGITPTVQTVPTPTTGTLTLTGRPANRYQSLVLTVPQGQLSFVMGHVDTPLTVSTGGLLLTGQKADFFVGPASSSPTLQTVTGALFFGENPNTSATINTGSLSFASSPGSLLFNTFLQPTVGSLTATGTTSSVFQSYPPTPPVDTLTLTATTPIMVIDDRHTPNAGSLQITTGSPTFPGQNIITPTAGSLTVRGTTSHFSYGFVPSTGALTITGITSTLFATQGSPMVGALSLIGYAPTVQSVGVVKNVNMRKTLAAVNTRTKDRQKVKDSSWPS